MNRIVMIYNAESGWMNKFTDWSHKMFSPSSYECDLCSLSHGNFGMKKNWEEKQKSLPFPVSYYYKDSFVKEFPDFKPQQFPLVLLQKNKKFEELLNSEKLSKIDTPQAFFNFLEQQLQKFD